MLTRRIIPCLDVIRGRVTKGVKFQNNADIGDPVELATRYYREGCDELVVYDITASAESRPIDIEMVRRVARAIQIPFTVGGGVSSLADMRNVLAAGAEKISLNSLAVANPGIITQGADAFGVQCMVIAVDPVRNDAMPSGYEITTHGFRTRTGLDALAWAREAERLGAGEIVVNSVDADGTRQGFDLALTRVLADALRIPVIASGGGGNAQHLYDVFTLARADAAILAGILHSGEHTLAALKADLAARGLPMRMLAIPRR